MPKHLTRKLSLAVLSTVAALAGAELLVGHFFPVRALNLALEDELLYAPLPNTRKILPMASEAGGARVLVRINSRGFRGPELREPKDGLRVAIFGDSLAMAENVAFEETFAERLREHLTESLGRAVETVNAGVSGYGPDQALKRLERELPTLDADLVLLVLCAHNDFGDLMRNKMFLVAADGELRDSPFEPGAPLRARFAQYERDASELALVRRVRFWRDTRAECAQPVRETSFPFMNLYLHGTGGQGGLMDEYRSHVERRDPFVDTALQDYYDADVALQPDWPSTVYKKRLMAAVLRRIARTCADAGTALAAVVVPSAVDLDESFQIRVDPIIWPDYDPRTLSAAYEEALAASGVPQVALFDLFAANEPGTLFASYRDIHWNERCQELAASHVASFLIEDGLIGP